MFLNLNTGVIGVSATLEKCAKFAAEYGFAGIDFSIEEAADLADRLGLEQVRALFDSAGLKPGAWGMPVNFRQDEAAWRSGLARLPRLAKTAHALGAKRTATWIMPADDERDFDANFAFHVGRLKPIGEILADHDIRFGLEFVGPKTLRDTRRYPFIYTMAGMLELCDTIGTGNMGLLVDLFHVYTSHGQNEDILKLTNDQVVNVHVNDAQAGLAVDEQLDNVRDLPAATGVTDVVGFLQALAAIGYDGPVTSEPFSQRLRELEAEEAVRETATAMQKMWAAAGMGD
jgi:sugar phosphate isomerase/epimerase